MHWVKEFYSLQNKWLSVYLGEIDDQHHQRAQQVCDWLQQRPALNLLELGAGGGQTAIALAQAAQHHVVALELLPESVQHAQQLVAENQLQSLVQPLQADFYTAQLPLASFDAVCYFDSFGIGSDADQQRLLQRIAARLKPNGKAIIEVGMPWYWANKARGQSMEFEGYTRRYDFDPVECRLLDFWYPTDQPEQKVWQRLRCYSPADMQLLLQGTGLHIEALQPNGYVDYTELKWVADAPLIDCMTYYVLLAVSH